MSTSTPVALSKETFIFTIDVDGCEGYALFKNSVDDASRQLKEIQAREERPRKKIGLVLDIRTPVAIMPGRIRKSCHESLLTLFADIFQLRGLGSYSVNITKRHISSKTSNCRQQDRFLTLIVDHLGQMAGTMRLPTIAVRMSANIEDEYPWTVVNSSVRRLRRPQMVTAIRGLCVILDLRVGSGFHLGKLTFDIDEKRRRLANEVKLLREIRPEIQVAYHVQGGVGTEYEFEEVDGMDRVGKLLPESS